MKTKTLFRIMAAIAIVALPFLAFSCGDDDSGPVTHTYSWELTGINLNNQNDSVTQSWFNARKAVNTLIANAISQQGFTVDANNQQFSIQLEQDDPVSVKDELVESTILDLKRTSAFSAEAQKLPADSKVVIKRGKVTVVDRKLR